MSNPAVPATLASKPMLEAVFGSLWPEAATAGRPRLVLAALSVGLLAAVIVPFRNPGLGTFLALAAVCGVVAVADPKVRTVSHAYSGLLCLLLTSTVLLRDAQWIVALCLMAAFGVGSVALTGGRSVTGLMASGAAVALAGLRGLPWLGRSLSTTRHAGSWWPVLRTAALSLLLVVVFGALFASADALFATWVGVLVPDLTSDSLFLRGFVLAAVFGLTLAGVYVALNPPHVERLALPSGQPVARTFEWLAPVGLVVVVFAVFVVAQMTAMFGGHSYLRRTTGLTYADYVHQGFGQLTFVTLLTLGVVAAAIRKAPRATSRERLLMRVVLGCLCGLTLVIVASALYRMHIYEQAYGFTRLRLLVSVFEGWLGLVVVLVLLAGITLHGPWVPRVALLTGAVMLLGLAAINPDGYIAEKNIDRFEQTGKVDWYYLAGLSADAAPALAELPGRYLPCVLGDGGVLGGGMGRDDWLEWNFGRSRARDAVRGAELTSGAGCRVTP